MRGRVVIQSQWTIHLTQNQLRKRSAQCHRDRGQAPCKILWSPVHLCKLKKSVNSARQQWWTDLQFYQVMCQSATCCSDVIITKSVMSMTENFLFFVQGNYISRPSCVVIIIIVLICAGFHKMSCPWLCEVATMLGVSTSNLGQTFLGNHVLTVMLITRKSVLLPRGIQV